MWNRERHKYEKTGNCRENHSFLFLAIIVVVAIIGIIYMLIVYDSKVNTFFNSSLNLIIAISLLVVFAVLIVVIDLLNQYGGVNRMTVIENGSAQSSVQGSARGVPSICMQYFACGRFLCECNSILKSSFSTLNVIK